MFRRNNINACSSPQSLLCTNLCAGCILQGSRQQWTINSGKNALLPVGNLSTHIKPTNTHSIMFIYANYFHKTKLANGEKACLQHTRVLPCYDEGKCFLKILHVTFVCLASLPCIDVLLPKYWLNCSDCKHLWIVFNVNLFFFLFFLEWMHQIVVVV